MPETLHCSQCGRMIHAMNFEDGMAKLRRHYKEKHPKKFKESIKKAVKTRKTNKKRR
jgi:hypothetical protein